MSLILNNPIEQYTTFSANAVLINSFTVNAQAFTCIIDFEIGEIVDGVFKPLMKDSVHVSPDLLVPAMTAPADSNKTIYENVKEKLFAILQQRTGYQGVIS